MKDVPGWEVSTISNGTAIQCSCLLITWSSGVVPFGSRLRRIHDSLVKVSTTIQTIGLRRRSWLYDGSSFSLYHVVEQSESAADDEPQLRILWMDDERLVAGAVRRGRGRGFDRPQPGREGERHRRGACVVSAEMSSSWHWRWTWPGDAGRTPEHNGGGTRAAVQPTPLVLHVLIGPMMQRPALPA